MNKFKTPEKERTYIKTRLAQIRGNLHSMIDSGEQLLTREEILQLDRISCKVSRVISLFEMRTMDLKREGKL